MAIKSISYYLDLVTSQHRASPKFMAFLEALLTPLMDTQECQQSMIEAFDISLAVGDQLDIIGSIIGLKRTAPFDPSFGLDPVMDDPTYRLALRMKTGLNQWKGQKEELYSLWESLFPAITLEITDNQDMTMDVEFTGTMNTLILDLIQRGSIFPIPQGVGVNFYYNGAELAALGPFFGLDLNTSTIKGLDEGYFS